MEFSVWDIYSFVALNLHLRVSMTIPKALLTIICFNILFVCSFLGSTIIHNWKKNVFEGSAALLVLEIGFWCGST